MCHVRALGLLLMSGALFFCVRASLPIQFRIITNIQRTDLTPSKALASLCNADQTNIIAGINSHLGIAFSPIRITCVPIRSNLMTLTVKACFSLDEMAVDDQNNIRTIFQN